MAALPEIAPQQRLLTRLDRPVAPFIEDVRHTGWIHLIDIRHEYPIYVGEAGIGVGREIWRQYLKDPRQYIGHLGKFLDGWTGPEVEAYRAFTYQIGPDGEAGEILEDQFIRDRRFASDLNLPLDVVDQMFDRPPRGVPRVEYVDTAAGRVIKKIHFE